MTEQLEPCVERMTEIVRMLIKNQNHATRTNSIWPDVPVSSQMAEEMAVSAFRLTKPVEHNDRIIVTHERMARSEMASHLKTMFEDQWSWVIEDVDHNLPMWVKSFVIHSVAFVDWCDLAATWTAHVGRIDGEHVFGEEEAEAS